MRSIPAFMLLDVWERGQALPPAHRALLLLDAADPDAPPGVLEQLPVGTRDARLMTLRRQMFGEQVEGVVACPACGEQLELQVPLAQLRSEIHETAGDAPEAEPFTVTHGGYTVQVRVPTAGDLIALVEDGSAEPVSLLRRCVLDGRRDGAPVAPGDLPGAVVATLAERMAAADPMASVQLALTCPACDHSWHAPFDIVSYFWAELDDWAKRTLRSVQVLAAAYGWREADILAMSAVRRQWYLNHLHA